MSSTLLNFQEKYYKYGAEGLETKGFVIRGYDPDFLVDFVSSGLFKVPNYQLKDYMWKVIDRDN